MLGIDEDGSDRWGACNFHTPLFLCTTNPLHTETLRCMEGPVVTLEGDGPVPEDAASLSSLAFAANQIEILFVLCSLLGGKRKVDVQHRLARKGLVPALERLFSALSWIPRNVPLTHVCAGFYPPPHPNLHVFCLCAQIHGPDCECNPDNTVRIQLLRLVMNFCDRDSQFKATLLSSPELQQANSGAGARGAHLRPPEHAEGLISAVVRALLLQEHSSAIRFWTMSCIESFLRNADPRLQWWLASGGLLEVCNLSPAFSPRP